jgi:hypothetical protein
MDTLIIAVAIREGMLIEEEVEEDNDEEPKEGTPLKREEEMDV